MDRDRSKKSARKKRTERELGLLHDYYVLYFALIAMFFWFVPPARVLIGLSLRLGGSFITSLGDKVFEEASVSQAIAETTGAQATIANGGIPYWWIVGLVAVLLPFFVYESCYARGLAKGRNSADEEYQDLRGF